MSQCALASTQLASWTNGEGPRPTEPGIAGSSLAGVIFHEYAATWLDFHDPSVVSWHDVGLGKTCRA